MVFISKKIKIIKPYIPIKSVGIFMSTVKSGQLSQGPKVDQFEKAICEYTQAKYSVAVSSASTGIHLSLVALGIGLGDEVIIPDFTFPATVNAVLQVGAVPVLADINLDTFNIDELKIESLITSKTKAILVVHAFGLCSEMNKILEIAKKNNLVVIEDAACAIGSKYLDKHAGTFGNIGIFSFHPRKIITTGEGGMIILEDANIADKLRYLRSHGGIKKNNIFEFISAGFNYRMSDINASIGIPQIQKLEKIIEKRINLANLYIKNLSELSDIVLPTYSNLFRHTFQSFVILLKKEGLRDKLILELNSRGVETTIGTYSLSEQPYLKDTFQNKYKLANSKIAFYNSLTLPLSYRYTKRQINRVSHYIKEIMVNQ